MDGTGVHKLSDSGGTRNVDHASSPPCSEGGVHAAVGVHAYGRRALWCWKMKARGDNRLPQGRSTSRLVSQHHHLIITVFLRPTTDRVRPQTSHGRRRSHSVAEQPASMGDPERGAMPHKSDRCLRTYRSTTGELGVGRTRTPLLARACLYPAKSSLPQCSAT